MEPKELGQLIQLKAVYQPVFERSLEAAKRVGIPGLINLLIN